MKSIDLRDSQSRTKHMANFGYLKWKPWIVKTQRHLFKQGSFSTEACSTVSLYVTRHVKESLNLPTIREETLYNNYSETRNLIGQCPCRMRQSCTGTLKVDIWLVNTRAGWDNPAREVWKLTSLRILRACYRLKIADKKHFNFWNLQRVKTKSNAKAQSTETISFYVVKRL